MMRGTHSHFQHEQLSRAKDPNKSSKNKKDSTSGTASPSSGSSSAPYQHSQSPVSSNHATPVSSSTTVNDIRNKPLPPNDPRQGPGVPDLSAGNTGQLGAGASFMQQHAIGGLSPGALGSGPGTPTRIGGPVAPSVIISHSGPPVSSRLRMSIGPRRTIFEIDIL